MAPSFPLKPQPLRRSCPGPVGPTGPQARGLDRAAPAEWDATAQALGRGLSQNTAVRPGRLLRSRVDGCSDFSLGTPIMMIFMDVPARIRICNGQHMPFRFAYLN